MIINADWYVENEGRNYPLDDTATAVTTAGERIPSDILVDLQVRWVTAFSDMYQHQTGGNYAYLSAINVSPNLVCLTIEAVDSTITYQSGTLQWHTNYVHAGPYITFSMLREDIVKYRQYPLSNGAGWVVFGAGIDRPFTGRFANLQAGLLSPRAARPLPTPPVPSVGIINSSPAMTGVVALQAVAPLVVEPQVRTINGKEVTAIVFRLAETGGKTSVFQTFAGPCGGRPDSRTCGTPEPIESINGVAPDCDGKLVIELQGCATVTQLDSHNAMVDCELGLSDVCAQNKLPEADGTLPNEYADTCEGA